MVIKADGPIFKFKQSENGLYDLDAAETKEEAYMMENTVAGNWSKYTNADYLHAVAA